MRRVPGETQIPRSRNRYICNASPALTTHLTTRLTCYVRATEHITTQPDHSPGTVTRGGGSTWHHRANPAPTPPQPPSPTSAQRAPNTATHPHAAPRPAQPDTPTAARSPTATLDSDTVEATLRALNDLKQSRTRPSDATRPSPTTPTSPAYSPPRKASPATSDPHSPHATEELNEIDRPGAHPNKT